MNERNELIHEVGNFGKWRRNMISNVDWFFSETPTMLANTCNSDMVQCPERIFVKCERPLL
jgi:hypothetical protein